MNLVIVESPTKAKTITKFLGKEYKIESSFGHIRDLPKTTLGVDVENNFTPKYLVPAKAKKNVAKLKELAKKAKKVILATDEDREGEAIAWHLSETLGLDHKKADRIVFHEITKSAITEAIDKPRKIDMKLVDAQQARRIVDRLVGYEMSPFLWKKVAKGLSAGRVQSVAVRLIVEREREIKAFKPEEYWSIDVNLNKEGEKEKTIKAHLHKIDDQIIDRLEIKDRAAADKITDDLHNAKYIVADVEKKEAKKSPPKPFTTSTLQQTANRMLGFSAKQTMMLAQQLYEGIDINGEGSIGLITYMRTDSLNLSDKFLHEAHDYLQANIGDKYCLAKPRRFKTKSKGAQEAHEAIRPADPSLQPDTIAESLNKNQYRLYKLIWQRALASQMPEAIFDATAIDIDAANTAYQFRTTGQIMKFDGYLKIYPETSQEIELPDVKKKEKLEFISLDKEQHFTKPPARYSDAGLVKVLERYGIGRPSTYAPTIATIENRNYVQRDDNKKLFPTDIAFVVNDLLVEHFPAIVDYEFTAKMENDLDEIAEGNIGWQPVIKDFYTPFHKNLITKYQEIDKNDIMPEEQSQERCDKCGAPMLIKTGRYGKFLACSAFPDCKNIKSMPGQDRDRNGQADSEQVNDLKEKYKDEICDKCGSPMTIKVGRFGPFLACTGYPKCKNLKNIKENSNGSTGVKCPVCGEGEIVAKRGRRGIFYACNRYPECKTAFWGKPTGEKCPECDSLLIADKNGVKCSNKECDYKK